MHNALLALTILAAWSSSAPAQAWAEKLFTKGTTHDFGTVPRGALSTWDFPITNIYAVPLEITDVKSGCGCVSASASKRVLQPKESAVITVRMDGKRYTGLKTVGVRVTVGPKFISSTELRVTANGRADVVFNPGEVNFGPVVQGQTPTQAVDVEYAGALNWSVTEVVARDMPFTVTIKESYRRPGQVGYRLSVTLKADAPAGLLKHELLLKTNDPASPAVPLVVEGQVVSSLTVAPASISLGAVTSGVALTRRVVVKGSSPFLITRIQGVGEGIDLDGGLPGKSAEVQFLTFRLKFDTPGPLRRRVLIYTSAQDTPLTVDIEGTVPGK